MMSSKEKQKKKLPKDSMTLLPCFYFVELPIVASSIVTLYFLELTDLFRPARVGFQCFDRSLSMPYVESSEELIPLLMLLSLAFAAPAASIMIGEGIVYCCQSKLKNKEGSEGSINAGGCNFNSFLRRTVRFVGVHVFGLCATALVTDVIQLATGYHAPFFLTVCKPNYTLLGMACDTNPYITQDICSGPDHHAIVSARKSFPSQHATISAFAAVYISMYFNSTISDCTKLLKPVLVFAFAIAAGICGLTQITQYRSHPIDVYVGFVIGAGVAAYLGFHAVGNFKASEDSVPTRAPASDGLRPLTHLRHDSVYQQSKSISNDELSPQPRLDSLNHHAQREKNSLNSLKRASVDVELLAPRSPMGKENMVTFSNTLPRVNTPNLDEAARRHMTIHVSMDASRSKQLISQWKQKSLDGGSLDRDPSISQSQPHMRTVLEACDGEMDQDEPIPSSLYPTVQARSGERGAGARVMIQARPGSSQLVHIPEETQGSVSTSPKSNSARAKWMLMAEKGGVPRPNNQPRIMQVIAMSKQQGITVTPKHSEGSSSSDSSHYRSPSERDSSSMVTVDAHGSHPIVHISSGNGGVGSWEWKSPQSSGGADLHDAYEMNDLNRDYRSFRSATGSGVSPGSSASDLEQEDTRFCSVATINVTGAERGETNSDTLTITSSRDSTLRRKPNTIFIGDRESSTDSDQDNYYKKLQANRRFKD
ncbi:LOW QUALITY PROTEIN: phospholipid phosphatase-related protein type 3 [Callorhinchus milii]|uniref:LOW QUALITY PROTEIN: phospholipid phosphatase-related protein type 3 n=1 Tax=Callorhinchus milii TaxID=7868 RepID=UPI001C3F6417|nr:LOW QUALITY PROTEIN: phospholipid phosphatase-related protein type 3 [Callorhinchus milii]